MRAAALATVLFACACRQVAPPKLTDAVPASATAIAGADLAALRASPLFAKLPPAVTSLRDASQVLLIWDGRDLLIVAAGTPAGYTPIAPGLSATGPAAAIAAAQGQLGSGRPGNPELVAHAGKGAFWTAIHGDGRLPLTGNLANLFNLLRAADYTTLSAELHGDLTLGLTAICPTAAHAERFESSLRAMVTMATVAIARRPDAAAQLRSVRIAREDRTVHATGSASPDVLEKLF